MTVIPVRGADPQTFTILYPEADFARDATHFYLNGAALAITPQNTRAVPTYEGPSTNLFYDSKLLYSISAAAESGNPYQPALNDRGVISTTSLQDRYYRKVQDIDPKADEYTSYSITPEGVWYKDDTGVTKKVSTDIQNFEIIAGLLSGGGSKSGTTYLYARDSAHIYYKGVLIPNADRQTLLPDPANDAYSTDKTNVFFDGSQISNADPATFESLWFPVYEGCGLSTYAKDSTHVFYKNMLVPGADPKSFKSLIPGAGVSNSTGLDYGKDIYGIYINGVLHKEINPQTFSAPECNYG